MTLVFASTVRCRFAIQTNPPPIVFRVPDQKSPADALNRTPNERARFGEKLAETLRKV